MGIPDYSNTGGINTDRQLAAGRSTRYYPRESIESGISNSELPFGFACLLENGIAKAVASYLQYALSVYTGNKGIKFSSVEEGTVWINIVYAVSGYLTPLTIAVTGTGVEGDPYVITVNVETEDYIYGLDVFTTDKGIRYTAVEKGVQYIDVVYVVAGNLTPLSIVVTGTGIVSDHFVITCNLETDAGGVAVTTALALHTALLLESDVTDIVTPTLLGTGATVLTAFALAPLVSTAAGGVPLSTAAEVETAIDADEDASALVTTALLGTGATVVTAFSSAPLTDETTTDYPQGFGVVMFGINGDVTNQKYLTESQVGVGKTGYFAVSTYEEVAEGDPVRVRLVTDGDALSGMWGTDAVANETALIEGARYLTYANNIAEVFLPDSIKFIEDV